MQLLQVGVKDTSATLPALSVCSTAVWLCVITCNTLLYTSQSLTWHTMPCRLCSCLVRQHTTARRLPQRNNDMRALRFIC